MNSFVKEPARLAAERQRLHGELVQASLEHYPVFIRCAAASAKATADTQACRTVVGHLCKDIDALEAGCTVFAETGQQWKAGRAQAAHLINNHAKLLELLEVPQLLETCLRNEMYHEALLLHDHVKMIAETNMQIPLVRMIAAEVEATMKHLLAQILARLASELSLAVCMKVVAFLSRLKIMSEKELRVVFLQKRYQYLQSLLADAAPHAANPASYMSKVTSVIKIHLFDILTQYQSVFPAHRDPPKNAFDAPVCDVIASWLLAIFEQYLGDLRKYVALISSGSELRSLLDQCMNCGFTLSRLGIDIRGLIIPIFTQRVVELYGTAAEQAYSAFAQAMTGYRWTPTKAAPAPRPDPEAKEAPARLAPPPALLQHPPLAHAANGFLAAFNEIRRCSPVSAAHDCAGITARVLQLVVDDVVKIHETTPFEAAEEAKFLAFVKIAAEEFLGYVCRCLDAVFDAAQLLDPALLAAPLLAIGPNVASPPPALLPRTARPPASPLTPVPPPVSPLVAAEAVPAVLSEVSTPPASEPSGVPAPPMAVGGGAEAYPSPGQDYGVEGYSPQEGYGEYAEGYDYTAEHYAGGDGYDYGDQAAWAEGQEEGWDQQAWEGQEGWEEQPGAEYAEGGGGYDYGQYPPEAAAPVPLPEPEPAVPKKGKKAD